MKAKMRKIRKIAIDTKLIYVWRWLKSVYKEIYKIAVYTKLIYIWRAIKYIFRVIFSIPRYLRSIKEHGLVKSLRMLKYKLSLLPGIYTIRSYFLDKQLEKILREDGGRDIILSLSSVDWKIPLFQRPQHLALKLANQGFLYFYHTHNHYDFVDGYQKVGENIYLTNRFEEVFKKTKGKKRYIHVSNNMYAADDVFIDEAIKNGDKLIYDYLDEISPELAGRKIPKFVLRRHERLMKDQENCYVVATATKLYDDVARHRKTNFKLIGNGVVYEHFRNIKRTVPKEMEEIVNSKKPIIGYYGALATWFDYDLIKEVAKKRSDWNILLIGWDYDGSFEKSGLKELPNVYIVGSVDYLRLPMYAQWFDVCTIPFKINEITKATSPVKLFEYMALGKPIVTTPMPECKKYDSVLISDNKSKEFIEKVEEALEKRDEQEYQKTLEREARANTWEKKAEDIAILISEKDEGSDVRLHANSKKKLSSAKKKNKKKITAHK